ncbi:MAG: DUF2341 domain-containing protein [Chitinispirillaceae bacterium]|nr:DUF2341 domain-containing protein [Chitinispirillaceae bacterium]
MNNVILRTVLPTALLWLTAVCCTTPVELTGGSSSETVVGRVVNGDGSPAVSSVVTLYPSDYNPVADTGEVTLPTDTTDSGGYYRITAPDSTADYSVVATDPVTGTRAFVPGIVLTGDTTWAAEAKLASPGAVSIAVPESAATAGGYVYIPGTGIVGNAGAGGMVLLRDVPEGIMPSVNYVAAAALDVANILVSDVIVVSADTVIIPYPQWRYSARVYLNTTPSGADVAGDVTGFPVLLRLTKNNFDFSQVRPDGRDLRFSDMEGSTLSHRIERWDPVAELAEVWVKVDTIRGNDSTQSIVMHWGNPAASDTVDGTAVFDTAEGFQGVWHLGETGSTMSDATINGFDGTANGNQTRKVGTVGYGQFYDGVGDYTDMGNVGNPGLSGFTFCAWVKRASTGTRQTIAAKSTGGSASSSYGWLLELDPDGAMIFFMATDSAPWGSDGTFVLASETWITDTAWHHVAVVVDRSGEDNSRLYIDDEDVSILPAGGTIAKIGEVLNSSPLRLGADANGGNPWNGFMDECTLSSRVCPEDWVRMSFMNQKKDDRLVKFE